MKKDRYYFLKYIIRLAMVLALPVFCFITMAAVTFAADETDNVQVKALGGIPKDLSITYGYGDTHAERGRTSYKISADGKVVYEKTSGSRSSGAKQQELYQLTQEELQLIIRKIKDNSFFSLNNQYRNQKIMGGFSSYISVTMDQKTHVVAVTNTHQKEFSDIAGMIGAIIDKKRPPKSK
jgi:hypothetical protein